MMKKALIWAVYFSLWQGLALIIHKPIILPSFTEVLFVMIRQAGELSFWTGMGVTLLRVLYGTLIAFILALSLALLGYHFKRVAVWIAPLLTVSKTIPNITYILLILIWFSREASVTLITLLVVFPVLYAQIMGGLSSINPELLDVVKLYPETLNNYIFKVLLPLITPNLREGLIIALSLGFKVGVMAEILGQVAPGIGYLLYGAKVQFEIAEIFALTGWMILVVVLLEKGLRWILLEK